MRDPSLVTLLDREKVEAEVAKYFRTHIGLLRELVNYGTNLVVRCFSSSSRTTTDIVIIAGLLKQCVSMLDTSEILLSHAATLSASLPSRSLFECNLYLIWIMRDRTEDRAKQYYVWYLRHKAAIAKKAIKRQPEYENLKKGTTKFGPDFTAVIENLESKAIRNVQDIEKILELEKYKETSKKFSELEQKRRSGISSWYEPSGPSSVRDMACRLDMRAEYDLLYSHYSEVAHGLALDEHIDFNDGSLVFEPIRSLKGFDSEFVIVVSMVLDIYRRVLERYRPEELRAFAEKYVGEWRNRFRSIPKVEIHNLDREF